MPLVNQTRNICLAQTVIMADTFFTRLKGLLGRSGLPRGHCLVLKPCRSVHTMFMRFSIDLLFVDRSSRVVGLIGNLPPFRFSGTVKESCLVIELPAGTLASTGTSAGDTVLFTAG
ncbi:MAG: DUF192 domain-containing protein [Peptococcaceae bacterium]|nr:DUF192 domain-containing protein [Peptococcaceae bacterium]